MTKGALVDEFINVGFVKSGFTRTQKTFSITELGKKYFEEIQWEKLLKRALEIKP